jgi:hypothetical protein
VKKELKRSAQLNSFKDSHNTQFWLIPLRFQVSDELGMTLLHEQQRVLQFFVADLRKPCHPCSLQERQFRIAKRKTCVDRLLQMIELNLLQLKKAQVNKKTT